MKQRIAAILTLILLTTVAESFETGDCPSTCTKKKDYMGHNQACTLTDRMLFLVLAVCKQPLSEFEGSCAWLKKLAIKAYIAYNMNEKQRLICSIATLDTTSAPAIRPRETTYLEMEAIG